MFYRILSAFQIRCNAVKSASSFHNLRNVRSFNLYAVFLQKFLCSRIACRHNNMPWFECHKINSKSVSDFCSGRSFKYLVPFLFQHINDIIRDLPCMNQNHIIAYCVHQSVNMDIAIRLLHMVYFYSHAFKLIFYLRIPAGIAPGSG